MDIGFQSSILLRIENNMMCLRFFSIEKVIRAEIACHTNKTGNPSLSNQGRDVGPSMEVVNIRRARAGGHRFVLYYTII